MVDHMISALLLPTPVLTDTQPIECMRITCDTVGITSYYRLYTLSLSLRTYVTSHNVVFGILRLSKMAQKSNGTRCSYRADDEATNPFTDNKPSGSGWGETELKWFGIDIKRECSLQEIAPGNIRLMPLAKVLIHIRKNLDKDWGDVEALGVEAHRETFYGTLLNLFDSQETIPSYATSLVTSSPQTAGPSATAEPTNLSLRHLSIHLELNRTAVVLRSSMGHPARRHRGRFRNPRDRPNVDATSSEATNQPAKEPSRLEFERVSAEWIWKLEIDVELTAGASLSVINDGLVAGAKDAMKKHSRGKPQRNRVCATPLSA